MVSEKVTHAVRLVGAGHAETVLCGALRPLEYTRDAAYALRHVNCLWCFVALADIAEKRGRPIDMENIAGDGGIGAW